MSNNSQTILSRSATVAIAFGGALAALIVSAFIFAHTASAASIPKGFASKEDCVAKVTAFPAADIAAYGQERADNRSSTLEKYKDQVNKKYAAYDKSLQKAEAAYKKKVGSNPSGEVKSLTKNHKDSLLESISTASATLNSLKTEFEAAKAGGNQAGMAQKSCQMIYDLQIYSYFTKKLKTQYAVDGLYVLNTLNGYQRESALKLNEKNGGDAKIKAEIEKSPNPSARTKAIDDLQPLVDKVTAAAASAQPDKDLFKDLNAKIAGVKKSIADDKKAISLASSKANKSAKKKAKPAAKSPLSSSSPSSSSSTASSSDSSSKTANTTKKKTTKKAKKSTAKKCKAGQELVKNVNGASVYDYCQTICKNGEVRSAVSYVNCVCPKDFRRPPGKPRECVHKSDPIFQAKLPACPSGQKRVGTSTVCVGKCVGLQTIGCWKP